MKLDETDIKIIKILQKNARESIAKIARTIGISPNATLKRFEKIQKSGVIKKTFIPTYLPQYIDGKSQTYKMQLLIKSEVNENKKLIEYIKSLNSNFSQIELIETIGHFNIFVWIISEDPTDLHYLKDKIQIKKGVKEIKANFLLYIKDFYNEINLDHLEGKKNFG